MKTGYLINKFSQYATVLLLLSIAENTAWAQMGNKEITMLQNSSVDTAKKMVLSPKKMFGEITQYLVQQQQFLNTAVNKKIKHRIVKTAKLYPVPGGESRVALFTLPAYIKDYNLTIRSLVHGLSLTYRLFSPTAVFLDSLYRPTHFLGENKFAMLHGSSFKGMRSEINVMIDENRKEDKYLLIYTVDEAGLANTGAEYQQPFTSMLSRGVERSPDGKLELELHLR